MALARSTVSLLGFLATTALGAGLTKVNKTAGLVVGGIGAVCSVLNLIYNLCFRKSAPTQPIGEDWQKIRGNDNEVLLDSDEDADREREGASDPLVDVPLVPDNAPAVRHNPGVIAKMGTALSSMIGRKEPAKQL